MRAYQILNEYSNADAMRQGPKLMDRWIADNHDHYEELRATNYKLDDEDNITYDTIINWIKTEIDVTSTNKQTMWLISNYIDGDIDHLHDMAGNIKNDLEERIKLIGNRKWPTEYNDIDRIKNPSHLSQIIVKIANTDKKAKSSEWDSNINNPDMFEMLYNKSDGFVIIPQNFEASKWLNGQINCKWCISTSKSFWRDSYRIDPKTRPAYYIYNKTSDEWYAWVTTAKSVEYRDIDNNDMIQKGTFVPFVKEHKKLTDAIIKRAGGLAKLAAYHPEVWYPLLDNPQESETLKAIVRGASLGDIPKAHYTDIIVNAALKKDPKNVGYLENPSEEQYTFAVSSGFPLIDVKNRTETIDTVAVSYSPKNLEYIDNPTDEQYTIAVSKYRGYEHNAMSLNKVPEDKKSDSVIDAAIANDIKNIAFVPNPTKRQIQIAINNKLPLEDLKNVIDLRSKDNNDIISFAIKKDGKNIGAIDEDLKKEKWQVAAVSQNGSSIQYIKRPTKKVINIAVASNPRNLKFIPTVDDDIKFLAIQQDGYNLGLIANPTLRMVELAIIGDADAGYINPNGNAIIHAYELDIPNDILAKLEKAALEESPRSIEQMKNTPNDFSELRQYAEKLDRER